MRTNYILIDYENVQPTSIIGLNHDQFRVLVFVGATQNKLAFSTAEALQKLGQRAEYIKISGNGSNALDFHIAFHIGKLSAEDPTAFFHIVSKDAGFDPLILHLKERKIFASRAKDVSDIPLLKAANTKSAEERIQVILVNLQQRGASKPRTIKTLTSSISALFQKQLSEEELEALLKELLAKGYVVFQGTKVTYALPEVSS
jgi:hypothetical protein